MGLWEEGGSAVGLGKEGIEAVVGRCSGMRQAFCLLEKRQLVEKSWDECGSKIFETGGLAWCKVIGDD